MKGIYGYKINLGALLVIVMIVVSTINACLEQERVGLLGLRQMWESNRLDPSRYLPDWKENSQRDCCEWERVTCDNATGHVTDLFLTDILRLGDEYSSARYEYYGLPENICSINCSLFIPFSELRSLNLSFNFISQWEKNHGFERLSVLKKLEILDLNYNMFDNNTLYHSLGAITSLKTLILGGNGLGGFFPTYELAGLVNLEILDLSGTWEERQGLEKMLVPEKLENLNIGSNNLSVEVLQYLNSLTSLKVLNLEGNGFVGSFPAQELGNMRNLESLDLSSNHLTEIQELGNLKNLKILDLRDNALTEIQELGNLQNLESLDLSWNRLTEIQGLESLGKFQKLTSLDVSENSRLNRSNLFQSLSLLTSLKNLFLTEIKLVDPFPARELTLLPNLEVLDLSWNHLSSLTAKDCELLSTLNKMSHLDLSYNGFKKGVFRILDAIPSLRFLSLRNNNIKGSLSNQGLASLRFLEVLDLSANSFYGSIPPSIRALSSLKVLSLAYNRFNGSLPDQGMILSESLLLDDVLRSHPKYYHIY